MGDDQKIRMIERFLFVILLIGMSGAGFLYESYKEAVTSGFLVPLLIVYLSLCYAIYRGLLRLVVRRFGSDE
ncbi:MAG: hypothetical protein AB7U35_04270 [Sphingobium sp.]